MTGIVIFALLQIADIITTLVFLSLGVKEANPLVKFAIHFSNPLAGLLLVKTLALAFGFFWLKRGRNFARINVVFGALIIWNAVAIIKAPPITNTASVQQQLRHR